MFSARRVSSLRSGPLNLSLLLLLVYYSHSFSLHVLVQALAVATPPISSISSLLLRLLGRIAIRISVALSTAFSRFTSHVVPILEDGRHRISRRANSRGAVDVHL